MTANKLKQMTLDELVDRFAEFGVAQDEALLDDEFAKYNKLYRQMDEIENELCSRGTDARLSLLRLFDHPNAQVRVRVAARSLAVAPSEARKALEAVVASEEFPQAGDAGMLISGLDNGTFVPK
jgi:hypothetical protein